MTTYPLKKLRTTLVQMGAQFSKQKGKRHETVRYHGRVAHRPNPHDDPIDDALLNQILRELGITRREFFGRK